MRRKLIVVVLGLVVFLVSAAAGFAATTTYRGPMYWNCYCDGASSYSKVWNENWFAKDSSGVSDTMITFIDAGAYGYSWHGTVRSTASTQHTYANTTIYTPYVKKAYCRFYSGTAFHGSCFAYGV